MAKTDRSKSISLPVDVSNDTGHDSLIAWLSRQSMGLIAKHISCIPLRASTFDALDFTYELDRELMDLVQH